MTTPSWSELMILMFFGEAEETPFSGVLEVDGWYSGNEQHQTLPDTVRVHKSGRRYRVETLRGDVLFIRGTDRAWRFPRSADRPIMMRDTDDDHDFGFGSYAVAVERPRLSVWRDQDLAAPAKPPVAARYLGRDAWDVEITFSSTTRAAAQLTIDATNGMLLRWGSDLFGDDFRWNQLREAPDLDEALFTWDGDADAVDEQMRDAIARLGPSTVLPDGEDVAHRAGDARPDCPVGPLSVSVTAEPEVFEIAGDGSYHVGFDLGGFVSVFRRPHSDAPWHRGDQREGWTTWSEGGWDWTVRSSTELDATQLAVIRGQLTQMARDER
jgi:hypothetical protein